MGRGFEFVGGMIVPLGMGAPVAQRMIAESGEEVSGAFVAPKLAEEDDFMSRLADSVKPPTVKQVPQARPTLSSKPMNVVREAKRRLAEINRQLRDMRKLEREGAELRRLIAAAKEKPKAVVRSIARTAS